MKVLSKEQIKKILTKIEKGGIILAIKYLRRIRRFNLKEAHDVVQNIRRKAPQML